MSCGHIAIATLIVLVGLFILDVAPINQTMMCESYDENAANATTECPEKYFSQSYLDARVKFRAAAKAAKAVLEEYVVVEENGVRYTIDTAYIPGGSKESLLVHTSGVHGVEGFVGSGIQAKLLTEWNATRENGPSVLFVHAVNPWGMANFRRFNEHNVDLNRNFFATSEEFHQVKSRSPNIVHYEDLHDLLNPNKVPTLFERYAFAVRSIIPLLQHGNAKIKRAIVTGQYHCPTCVYYGGSVEEPSVTIIKKILGKLRGSSVKRVVAMDVHSGLGPEGVDTMMVNNGLEKAAADRVFSSSEYVIEDPTVSSGPNSGYDLMRGGFKYAPSFPGADVTEVTEEFGTVPGFFVARAIIMENSAFQLARGSYIHEMTKFWLRDVFYPQKVSFKKSVLARGEKAFNAAWGFLSSEHH